MASTRINSENKENRVESDPAMGLTTHCLVLLEQPPIGGEDPAPLWRLSCAVDLSPGEPELVLNTILIGPFIHSRQAVAIGKFPGAVIKWIFWFESDHGRAEALITLIPGNSLHHHCGVYTIPHPPPGPLDGRP
jgi:hypothetical protein